ncbi:hypothetical protein LLR08_17405 [Rouxiella badensis]|uniref:hypothetical protein n=1 Tax=Rouxiella badensis TaxID=1646377 RepID=UPI001D14445A|nr:hypothetical protein [Rouxiella badensis]MCC3704342.1 hypothetical protein [Rouxiella badensis]
MQYRKTAFIGLLKQPFSFFFKNTQLALSITLFITGSFLLHTRVSTIAGALFGAGASFLGAWVTELNLKRSKKEEFERNEVEAKNFLTPELNRIIERVLYIHSRSIPNFSAASVEYFKSPLPYPTKPNDLQQDFLPYLPVLYPNSEKFKYLKGEDAVAMVVFYDSLYKLEHSVRDWWAREGQLPLNLFLSFMNDVEKSLELAELCIERFDMDNRFPPKYSSWGSLSSRISNSRKNAALTLEAHMRRANSK